jgi:hypothetical protein
MAKAGWHRLAREGGINEWNGFQRQHRKALCFSGAPFICIENASAIYQLMTGGSSWLAAGRFSTWLMPDGLKNLALQQSSGVKRAAGGARAASASIMASAKSACGERTRKIMA